MKEVTSDTKLDKKDFMNENIDFKEGSLLAMRNAKNHFDIAIMAKDTSLGIANSHLILASEETIKADILGKIYINPDWLNNINLDEYFRNHKYKHIEGLNSQFVDSFLLVCMERMFKFEERIKKSNLTKEKKMKFAKKISEKSSNWLEEIGSEALQKNISNIEWWKQANQNKNLGFYVNLDKVAGVWNTPSDITQEQFDESYKIVSDLIDSINELLSSDVT